MVVHMALNQLPGFTKTPIISRNFGERIIGYRYYKPIGFPGY